jgi:quercetin dioxygenase-like cupin family protein
MKLVPQAANRSRPGETGKFTPGVWAEELMEAQTGGGMRAHRFFYAPGAHSHWHSHTGEQALYFVAGRGRIKRSGEEAFDAKPGDLVYVAPGEKHWHGATAEQFLVHLAFTASGKTDWMEEVPDDEYARELVVRSNEPH